MAENLNLKLFKISSRDCRKNTLLSAVSFSILRENVLERLQINVENFVLVNDYEGLGKRGDIFDEVLFEKLSINNEIHLVALEQNENISSKSLRYFEIPNYYALGDLIEELNRSEKIDLCFVMDCTPSMEIQKCIVGLETVIEKIRKKLLEEFPDVKIRKAFIGYRDIEDGENEFTILDFTTNFDKFKEFIKKVIPSGKGDDSCEDVLGGLNEVTKLKWESQNRVLIHICDAPGHSRLLHGEGIDDKFPDDDPRGLEISTILKKLVSELRISYNFFKINNSTNIMVEKFNEILVKMNLDRVKEFLLPSTDDIINILQSKLLTSITMTVFVAQLQTMREFTRQTSKIQKNLSLDERNLFWGKPDEFNEYKAKCFEFCFDGDLQTFIDLKQKYDELTNQEMKRKKSHILDKIEMKEKVIDIKIRKLPFAKGNLRYAYAAIVNKKVQCVVKNSIYENDDTDAFTSNKALISSQIIARFLAKEFDNQIRRNKLQGNKKMSFNRVKLIYIEETKEYYTIEKYIGKKFFKWNSSIGYVNEDIYANTLDAYSHWTYVATGNYLIVSDLQGFHLNDQNATQKYVLTDPAISCIERQFTSTDLGEIGIRKFFEKHICNKFCQKLKLLQPDFQIKREIRVLKNNSTDIRDDFIGGSNNNDNTSSDEF